MGVVDGPEHFPLRPWEGVQRTVKRAPLGPSRTLGSGVTSPGRGGDNHFLRGSLRCQRGELSPPDARLPCCSDGGERGD